jgi:flagellar hook-associated protein 1 FlgK
MPSTFFGLNIGKSGLYTYQAALSTTSHNVANAETDGYSRQVVKQEASKALRVNNTYGMAGSGVDVTGVSRERNSYYDVKFWENTNIYGGYNTKDHYMASIENYFNEINVEGFTTSFNSMFDSLQELTKNPSSLNVRTQVTNFAQSLTDYFNFLSGSMNSIQEECNFEIKNKVDQINSLGEQIASVTRQINTLEVNGEAANDLRDQRGLLLDSLSEIVNITVQENIVGDNVGISSYVVKINGQTLVDTYQHNTLLTKPRTEKVNLNDVKGLYDIVWNTGQTFDTNSTTLDGSLRALFEVRDGNNNENLQGSITAVAGDNTVTLTNTNINDMERLNIPPNGNITVGNRIYKYTDFVANYDASTKTYSYDFTLDKPLVVDVTNEISKIGVGMEYKGIPYYMGQMNEFVRTFSQAFNEQHRDGQDLDGNNGDDFFNGKHPVTGDNYILDTQESYYNITAANFTVTSEIYNNPMKLAVATNTTDGVEDNTVLHKLIALKSDHTMFRQGVPSSFLQTMVAEIGIDRSKAISFASSQENIVSLINNQRLSISGVDMDEEAMNLVRYQNAYNLSAKVITVMNEIYDKLINDMGV